MRVQNIPPVADMSGHFQHGYFSPEHGQINAKLQADKTSPENNCVYSGFVRVFIGKRRLQNIFTIDSGDIGLDGNA